MFNAKDGRPAVFPGDTRAGAARACRRVQNSLERMALMDPEIVSVLFRQIVIMFVLMFIGAGLFKTGKISKEGTRSLGNILIYIVFPAVVVKAFLREFTMERLTGFLIACAASLAALILSMLVSALIFRKRPIENFCASFSNAGFIGIPIVSVVFGDEAVFYVSSFAALLTILQWTYGVFVITKDKKQIAVKKVVTNPVVLSLAVGLILFLTPVEMPPVVSSTVNYLADLNAPLAMFSVGAYLAQLKAKEIFCDGAAWLSTAVRLILIPLLTVGLLFAVPKDQSLIRTAVLLIAATPAGVNAAVFAQVFDRDYKQAVKSICLSTICCIATLPLIISLAQWLWQ